MPSYLVRWEIEVDADDPESAVDAAAEMMPLANPTTTATCFRVWPAESAPPESQGGIAVDVGE